MNTSKLCLSLLATIILVTALTSVANAQFAPPPTHSSVVVWEFLGEAPSDGIKRCKHTPRYLPVHSELRFNPFRLPPKGVHFKDSIIREAIDRATDDGEPIALAGTAIVTSASYIDDDVLPCLRKKRDGTLKQVTVPVQRERYVLIGGVDYTCYTCPLESESVEELIQQVNQSSAYTNEGGEQVAESALPGGDFFFNLLANVQQPTYHDEGSWIGELVERQDNGGLQSTSGETAPVEEPTTPDGPQWCTGSDYFQEGGRCWVTGYPSNIEISEMCHNHPGVNGCYGESFSPASSYMPEMRHPNRAGSHLDGYNICRSISGPTGCTDTSITNYSYVDQDCGSFGICETAIARKTQYFVLANGDYP